ncbi:hypothetical protein KNE206_07720 [Kitasatospora sp. NE20-6]
MTDRQDAGEGGRGEQAVAPQDGQGRAEDTGRTAHLLSRRGCGGTAAVGAAEQRLRIPAVHASDAFRPRNTTDKSLKCRRFTGDRSIQGELLPPRNTSPVAGNRQTGVAKSATPVED